MSFLFSRARTRTNTLDLPKQAREHVLKLDGPGKVSIPFHFPLLRFSVYVLNMLL